MLQRVLKNHFSILSRVLQAKYYPLHDFSTAILGRHLLKGIRWHIGNGCLVIIWEDKRHTTPYSFKLSTPSHMSVFCCNLKVSCLIDFKPCSWKWDIIRTHPTLMKLWKFSRYLYVMIGLGIIQAYDKLGQFIVRSAYKLIFQAKNNLTRSESSSTSSTSHFFAHLCGLHTAPKLKVFLRRLYNNILPMRKNLPRRIITISLCCAMFQEIRSIFYIFFSVIRL